jgi:hypothetical protein
VTAAPDPELIRAAVEAVRGGASLRDVATASGVSHMTVARWVRAAEAPPKRGPGRPPALDAGGKAYVRRRTAQGAGPAQIGRELGVAEHVVERAVKAPPAPEFAGTGPVDAPPAPDLPLTPEEVARDPLERAKERLARLDKQIDRAFDAGNDETALSLQRTANELLAEVRKLEADRRTDGADLVTFTREQLEQGARLVRERLDALAADRVAQGGLVCVSCGERLRLAAAAASDGVTPGATRGG